MSTAPRKQGKPELDVNVISGIQQGSLIVIDVRIINGIVSTLLKRSSLVSDQEVQKLTHEIENAAVSSKQLVE